MNTCEYCDQPVSEESECSTCTAEMERQQAYYRRLYRSRGYSDDELRDAYSHATDYHKLVSLLENQ